MIVFRQVDARYPFLWASASQPAGRWHADGEGPVHYFADTPDGAWAELIRHEEITDPDDLPTIRRQLWAVEIGDAPSTRVELAPEVLTGGRETYSACQAAARALRAGNVRRIAAVSAALIPGGAAPVRLQDGLPAEPRDGLTIVIFGQSDGITGWVAAAGASPPPDLLGRVHHYPPLDGPPLDGPPLDRPPLDGALWTGASSPARNETAGAGRDLRDQERLRARRRERGLRDIDGRMKPRKH